MPKSMPSPQPETVIIDDEIQFQVSTHSLRNTKTGITEELSSVSSQLLLYLLINHQEITHRDQIFENVFIPNGAKATDPNLNQHILFIRKALNLVGCSNNIITTVPKIGFKIKYCDLVFTPPLTNHINESSLNEDISDVESLRARVKLIFRISVMLALSFIIFISYILFYSEDDIKFDKVDVSNEFKYKECTVKFISYGGKSSITNAEAKELFSKAYKKPDCTFQNEIYYFKNSISSGNLSWEFFASCNDRLGNYECAGQYYYEVN